MCIAAGIGVCIGVLVCVSMYWCVCVLVCVGVLVQVALRWSASFLEQRWGSHFVIFDLCEVAEENAL